MDNSIIFFKIWRNIVLYSKIRSYVKLFDLHYFTITINQTNALDFIKYPFKQYTRSLVINNNENSFVELFNEVSNNCSFLKELTLINSNSKYDPIRTKLFNLDNLSSTFHGLTILDLEFSTFNSKINNKTFPSSLTSLRLSNHFSQLIGIGSLPSSLKTLSIGKQFKQKLLIGSIPQSLEKLICNNDIQNDFSIEIFESLLNLKVIEFNGKITYDHFKNGTFSNSIKEISFSNKYPLNQKFSIDWLPSNIDSITIGNTEFPFDKDSFPSSLKSITILSSFNIEMMDYIPDQIEKIICDNSKLLEYNEKRKSISQYASKIIELIKLSNNITPSDKLDYILEKTISLRCSNFKFECRQQWTEILNEYSSLLSLSLSSFKQQTKIIHSNIPYDTIKYLCMDVSYWGMESSGGNPEIILLPKSLKALSLFGDYFTEDRYVEFPDSLEILSVHVGKGQSISKFKLPQSLKVLRVILNGQPFPIKDIPNSLKKIMFLKTDQPQLFQGDLNDLPKSLKSIHYCGQLNELQIDIMYPTHVHLLHNVSHEKLDKEFRRLVKKKLNFK